MPRAKLLRSVRAQTDHPQVYIMPSCWMYDDVLYMEMTLAIDKHRAIPFFPIKLFLFFAS